MKIGILTFHCAYNYGAVLQAFALQEYLQYIGNDVHIIDYRPKYLWNANKSFDWSVRALKSFIKKILIYQSNQRKERRFHEFWDNHLNLENIDLNIQPNSYDTFVFGSDQIWNATITGGKFDRIYFGDFEAARNRKLIVYAVSIGGYSLSPVDKSLIRDRLNNFEAISVREKKLQITLQEILHKTVDCVLDPSLLVDTFAFDSLISEPLIDRTYICIYEVTPDSRTVQIAKKLSEGMNGAKIIRIGNYLKNGGGCENIIDAGPIDFLNYIKYSACVVTTSFHGTAFSIIFKKPFFTLKVSNSSDSRITDLLGDLNLMNQYILDVNVNSITIPQIDYKNVEVLLDKRRNESRLFLDKIFSKEKC